MQLVSFTPNRTVFLFCQEFQVTQILGNDRLVLRDANSTEKTWSIETLIGHYLSGNLKLGKPGKSKPEKPPRVLTKRLVSDVSELAKAEGLVRKKYVDALVQGRVRLTHNKTLTSVLERVTKELDRARAPSLATVKRWVRLYLANENDDSALVPWLERRGGGGKSRLPAAVLKMMHATIDSLFLTTEGFSMKRAYHSLRAELGEKNAWLPATDRLLIPSYATFRREILRRPGYEMIASRQGVAAAELRYRSTGISTETHGFNACWETDHTVLDVFVVDPHTGLIMGRPRVTVMIDYFSRCVMGIDIDFTGTTAQAVLNCLKHAILPKHYVQERYPEVRGVWPCFGVPGILKCDNGPEFHATSLRDACFELGIELQYCPTKKPHFKARVERFFRTFNEQALAGLPGATGPHLYALPKGVDPSKAAVVHLKDLLRHIHIWIVDVYHPHKGTV